MNVRFIDRISDCSAAAWNLVAGIDYPFLRHEFLDALETSGSVGGESGWQPFHALLFDQDMLVAVMPLYLKSHSYGEYVFDWSWADAYQRNGLPYYPKLVTAIPFTPATGNRIATNNLEAATACDYFCKAITQQLKQKNFSGWHVLFPEQEESLRLEKAGLLDRIGVQYHWFNQGYQSFDHFLNTFKSRQRKNLRKERRRVYEQNVSLSILTGDQLTPDIWQHFYRFYQATYAKRSGHGGYLTREFFQLIGKHMASQIVMVMAYQDDIPIAAALNFQSSNTLYGRYWGAIREIDGLHFETCYYQGIEYCIANGLQRFDPGAQGEHKIQRGFTPVNTHSMHWIAHEGFRKAIGRFLEEESSQVSRYTEHSKQFLPFKNTD